MTNDDLKVTLFSATDGRGACEVINKLAKLAKRKGGEQAKSLLGDYMLNGSIDHMRAHACASLAEAIKEPHSEFAAVFRKGLTDRSIRYWSILGYINSAGKGAYEELIKVAEDNGLWKNVPTPSSASQDAVSKSSIEAYRPIREPGRTTNYVLAKCGLGRRAVFRRWD